MKLLGNKVIVVVGGAGLLGSQFCNSLLAEGGTVYIADKDIERANNLVSQLNSDGLSNVFAVEIDITSKSSINDVIELIQDKSGKIDGVVNNAYPRNKNYGRELEEVEYEDFCENLNLHLGGYFLVCQQMSIFFKKQGFGNIVNIGSIYGVVAPRFDVYEEVSFSMPVEYAAIKSGILHLTKYFAQFYKKSGIRVNSLCPGGIFDHQPKEFLDRYNEYCGEKGMLSPDDICGSLVFLLSDNSKYVNGQNIVVDDGFTL